MSPILFAFFRREGGLAKTRFGLLLIDIGLCYADRQCPDAGDHAHALRHADGPARVQNIEQVRTLQAQVICRSRESGRIHDKRGECVNHIPPSPFNSQGSSKWNTVRELGISWLWNRIEKFYIPACTIEKWIEREDLCIRAKLRNYKFTWRNVSSSFFIKDERARVLDLNLVQARNNVELDLDQGPTFIFIATQMVPSLVDVRTLEVINGKLQC